MHTISLCLRGVPILCELFRHHPRTHMCSPRMRMGVRFWRTSNLSLSHTLNQNLLSMCIKKHLDHSPYTQGGDGDPPLHTGIAWHIIPICIWGFSWYPYANGDNSVTNHMNMGNISIWDIKSCIPICKFSHTGIAGRIQGSGIPVCIQAGIAKKFAYYGDPCTHNEIVRIWGVTHTLHLIPGELFFFHVQV